MVNSERWCVSPNTQKHNYQCKLTASISPTFLYRSQKPKSFYIESFQLSGIWNHKNNKKYCFYKLSVILYITSNDIS